MAAVLVRSAAERPRPERQADRELAKNAYIWGLAPEFVYRFEKYNDLVTSPRNTLGGGSGVAAAWNNNATNAGDASVLYLNSMMDLSGQKGRGGTKELVLTVPPSQSNYYVVNLLDDFINSVGSIGTRTTPVDEAADLPARRPDVAVRAPADRDDPRASRTGSWPTDTNLNWMLIRIRADSLVPASDPASTASIQKRRRALRAEHARAVPGQTDTGRSTSSPAVHADERTAADRARRSGTTPRRTRSRFFKQVGQSLRLNPLPDGERRGSTASRSTSCRSWVVPQAGARHAFRNPSFGQRRTLARVPAASASPRTASRSRATGATSSSTPSRRASRPGRRAHRHADHGERPPGDQLLELPQLRRRDVSQHAPGLPLPGGHRARRRLGQHAGRRHLRPDQQPRRDRRPPSSTATTPTS